MWSSYVQKFWRILRKRFWQSFHCNVADICPKISIQKGLQQKWCWEWLFCRISEVHLDFCSVKYLWRSFAILIFLLLLLLLLFFFFFHSFEKGEGRSFTITCPASCTLGKGQLSVPKKKIIWRAKAVIWVCSVKRFVKHFISTQGKNCRIYFL